MNLFKNSLAILLFLPTLYIFNESLFRHAPSNEYFLLLLSGALGIGIADTMFFASLNLLGAGLSAIVNCLYSPFIIALSILWLGESLSPLQIVGALLIVSAVLTTTSTKGRGKLSRRNFILGAILGVMSMAAMAVGIVMIKPLLNRSPLLWVTEIRLFGGIIMLFFILLFHPYRRKIIFSLSSVQSWKYTVSGSFIGTYLAMILWLAGMKFTQTSTAAALNQTSNIFIFVFAAVLLKEAINLQRTVAIILAVSGAFMVTFG